MVRDAERPLYPELPERRSSILPQNPQEETAQPLPWKLPAKEFQKMSTERIQSCLQVMDKMHQDYEDLLLAYDSLREETKKRIKENDRAAARVDEAEEQFDGIRVELDEAKQKQEQAERLLEVVLRQSRADTVAVHQKSTKLPDPPVLTDGKEPTIDHWSQKMRAKLTANADHYPTEELKMAYLASRAEGTANLHLAPRLRPTAANKFSTAEEMLEALDRVFGDPHRRQTAMNSFRKLYQKDKDFNTFWSEFQRLAAELETMTPEFLLDEFRDKVNTELKKAMVTVDIPDVYELAQKCQEWDRRIQQNKIAEARSNKFKPTGTVIPAGAVQKNPETKTEGRPTISDPRRDRTPERDQLREKGKCFVCRRTGHIAAYCPSKVRKEPAVVAVEESTDSGKE